MKSSSLPSIRVEPQLREELEAVLGESETVTEFVEDAVRSAVERRRAEAEFLARGEAAWQAYVSSGLAVPAEDVLAKVQDRLEARRKQLAGRGR
jgi:hypothetical protein